MPIACRSASALCVKQTPDTVLVVGGRSNNYAELLFSDARQAEQPWRWRTLSPMHEAREKTGVLLLNDDEEIQRILVAGGSRYTAELLTIACTNTSDHGQWTSIAPFPDTFVTTSLVCYNGRTLAFGRCSFCLIQSFR